MSNFKENWNRIPKWFRIVIYSILGLIGAVGLGALFGFVIMWLWNWLMPMLFHLPQITYWQGIGIFVLAKILFGSIGGSGGSDSKKPKDKKERRFDPHIRDERKAEPDGVEVYDEWWEKKGKMAFDDFVNNRCASEKANETESERGKGG